MFTAEIHHHKNGFCFMNRLVGAEIIGNSNLRLVAVEVREFQTVALSMTMVRVEL